eukprot:5231260-Ditylum_brightwellii.AAC.1
MLWHPTYLIEKDPSQELSSSSLLFATRREVERSLRPALDDAEISAEVETQVLASTAHRSETRNIIYRS